MIEVVTFYSPRPGHEKLIADFGRLMILQKKTAEKFGHRHVVISDRQFKHLNVCQVSLPESLMKAILAGQVAYLEQWSGEHPVVMVDADCLIARNLAEAFWLPFDLGLTNREHDSARINNGAMYIAPGNKPAVLRFFKGALASCQDHWGGDQEAISRMAEPIPLGHCIEARRYEGIDAPLRMGFFSMKTHNVVPTMPGVRHKKNPYVVHFKGDRKQWMELYASKFIL